VKARAAVTPIALLVLAAGAGAYAFLVDRGTVSDADRAARRRDVFPSFRVDEVSRIELDHGSEALVLERASDAGASWTMTSPRQERADPGAVDALLRELETAARLRDVEAGDAKGLDSPRVRGTIRLAALEYRFSMGDDAPRPDGGAYLRLETEGTFVVSRALKVQLLRGADAYRDRALVAYGEGDVARLEVAARGGGFVLDRSGGTFRVGPEGTRASRSAVDHLFAALADARADVFLDDTEADRALGDAPTVVLVPGDPARPAARLRVGGPCPGGKEGAIAVRLAPTRMSACIARTLADALAVTASSFADTSPFFAHADEIEDLRLERLGVDLRVDVARKGTAWRERAPEDRDLTAEESDSASALAAALADARATDVHHGAPDEAFSARVRVTVVRTGSSVTEIVELGAPQSDGTTLLRRLDDGATLRLSADASRRFQPLRVALRASAVWRPALEVGAVVAVDDTCGPSPERLELRDGTWAMQSPAGFASDPVAVVDLTGAMAHAKAYAWIAEADDGSFGFGGAGACQVMLGLAGSDGGQARRDGIVFGAATAGGFFAHTLGDPAIFVTPGVLRELASHPAIERRRFRLDPAALASLALVHGGERRIVSPDASDDDRLVQAVAALVAQVALHTGPPARAEGMDRPSLDILATARPDGGAATDTRVSIGAATRVDEADGYFARVAGLDATFFVPKQIVDSIIALLASGR
jgi:Domain of unknown function (DUF4340)